LLSFSHAFARSLRHRVADIDSYGVSVDEGEKCVALGDLLDAAFYTLCTHARKGGQQNAKTNINLADCPWGAASTSRWPLLLRASILFFIFALGQIVAYF
jgi:hypothetical protein